MSPSSHGSAGTAPQVSLPNFPEPTYVDIDGHQMAYVDTGRGVPVVLVHGNPTWSYLWRSLLRSLPAAGHRAIAPDHIGMGRSDRPTARDYPHTLSRRISDFAAFMAAVVPEGPVSLIVHDWGGPIALSWAADNADRIDRLVLLNTGAFPLPSGKGIPLPLRLARLRPIGPALVRRANAFLRMALRFGVARRLPADVRAAYSAPYDRPSRREAIAQFVLDIPTGPQHPAYAPLHALEQGLHRLADKPTLLVWGMRDIVFDDRVLRRFEQILPHARTVRIAEAAHYVSEDAAELLDSLVPAFLDEGRADSAPRPPEDVTIDLRADTPSSATP